MALPKYSEFKDTPLHLVSPIPQAEEEILSNTPIQWKIGELNMLFPRMCYRDYRLFEKALKYLGLQSLVAQQLKIPDDIIEALTFVGDELAQIWWDDFGLTWILAKFGYPIEKEKAKNVVGEWVKENSTRCLSISIDTDIEFRLALASYIAGHCKPEDLINTLNGLLESQYAIKKKVNQMLTNPRTQNEIPSKLDSQQLQRTQKRLALIQQRRLRESLMQSSSPL